MTAPLRELPPMRVTATVHQTAAVVARRASAQKVAESAPPRVQREVREERVPEAAKPAPVRPVLGGTTNLTLAELASLIDKQKRGQILDTTELDEDDTVSNAPVVLVSSQASLAARMLRRR